MRYLHPRLLGLLFVVVGLGVSRAARAEDAPSDNDALAKVVSTYKEQVVVERTTTTREAQIVQRVPKPKYSCAIFVANRAERIDDKKVLAMQDFLVGHATDAGFNIISREDVINSVADLAKQGPNRGDERLAGADLDKLLSNNTSALRLAQSLNADYVLMVTITSYGTDKHRFNDPRLGIDLLQLKHQMKTTYRLLDTTVGGSQTAGVATVAMSERLDPTQAVEHETLIDDLLDGAAMDMTAMLRQAASNEQIKPPEAMAGRDTKFQVNCGVADLVFPEIVKDEKGEYIVMAGRYRLESLSVTVEVDGVVIGTTSPDPAQFFTARPGLHKIRLRRQLFKDWQATINIHEGMLLQVSMEMTAEGLREFAEMTTFLANLKKDQILTEAQAKMWENYSKQTQDKGIRIEHNKNVNINVRHEILGDDEPARRKTGKTDGGDGGGTGGPAGTNREATKKPAE